MNAQTFVVEIPPGVLIRNPSNGRIVATGETLPRDAFWQRRLKRGEVLELREVQPADEASEKNP